MSTIHIPVLLEETLEALLENGGKKYIDTTVGTGGHSLELLSRTSPDVSLIVMDKDESSLEAAKERLKDFEERITFVLGGYENIDKLIEPLNPGPIAGIMFDVGMSSFQLDNPSRGFSFREEGVLDMRFDRSQKLKAKDIVNTFSEKELRRIFLESGEKKWARRLSRVIVEEREENSFETTLDLSNFIRRNIPRRSAHKTLARIFQAIRISVNHELVNLKKGLFKAFKMLDMDGRITVITYHSLEDRLVKGFFRTLKKAELAKVINPRSARPSKRERIKNRRSRSARLRVIRKINSVADMLDKDERNVLEEGKWKVEIEDD
jgi:16S rRNA (cytosine1402-N4)-methyltransferase